MAIEVESSYGFLYLHEDDVTVYVSYDLEAIQRMAEEEPPGETIIYVDPKGDRHLLVICPRMAKMKKPQKKYRLGLDLLSRYGRMQMARNPVVRLLHVHYLMGSLFDNIDS